MIPSASSFELVQRSVTQLAAPAIPNRCPAGSPSDRPKRDVAVQMVGRRSARAVATVCATLITRHAVSLGLTEQAVYTLSDETVLTYHADDDAAARDFVAWAEALRAELPGDWLEQFRVWFCELDEDGWLVEAV